jgi:hypothetical protein
MVKTQDDNVEDDIQRNIQGVLHLSIIVSPGFLVLKAHLTTKKACIFLFITCMLIRNWLLFLLRLYRAQVVVAELAIIR